MRPLEAWHGFGPRGPHPHTGPVTTDHRRFEMRRRAELAATGLVTEVGAFMDDLPVGACLVFTDASSGQASVHDVAVLEAWRGRGTGTALVAAGVRHARERESPHTCLISTAMGEGVYRRVGFVEVARIAYWYRGQSGGAP